MKIHLQMQAFLCKKKKTNGHTDRQMSGQATETMP